jgi:tetratricopeptide (TPR) repeat protein
MSREDPQPSEGAGRRARWRLDPAIAVCVVVLIAFPFAATRAASHEPIVPAAEQRVVAPASARGPVLRDLPAFTRDSPVGASAADHLVLTKLGAMRTALDRAMTPLFGPRQRRVLDRLLVDKSAALHATEPTYPFRFPRLDAALGRLDERKTGAANDLGALLVVAAARFDALPTAAPLAYAVLDRVRSRGGCTAQLNLAFLLSTHVRPRPVATATELREAARRCPHDPTPLWLLGEFQSQLSVGGEALATFARLQRRFPTSSAGWSGEADHELRLAYDLVDRQPFTARNRFRSALSLLRRARSLDPDPGLAAGEARADAGLALYDDAARAARLALRAAASPAPIQAALVEYLERGRHFGAAAREAARLEASARFPQGPALIGDHDGLGPLSLGSDRLLAVKLDVAPVRTVVGSGGGVLDLSFIPEFRDVEGVTGYSRWCPGWLRRRDLVLAGKPAEALAGLPKTFHDIRPGSSSETCMDAPDVAVLAAVAAQEARRGPATKVTLLDARQNMWRFAGDLDRARTVAAEWMRRAPMNAVAFDRAGEIEFLAKRYAPAARLFAASARRARARRGTWSLTEASALLKQGTALELARRYPEAQAALQESDEVATRVYGLRVGFGPEAAYVSYNARLQGGDTDLRLHRYRAALEHYVAAREWERALGQIRPGEPVRRPEVIDNNQAIVEIELGHPAAALAAARRALRADPENPVFLGTSALALERLGRPDAAAAAYRAALRSAPGLDTSWNDLGVVLARQHRLREAATAFRHAVGVQPELALGWFNLGVALERLGPWHAAASQGAFARAFRADPDLRGSARAFVADEQPYFTTLDLSKPLPPKWGLASTESRSPVAAAGVAIALLLGLRLGRGLLGRGAEAEAGQWLEYGRDLVARMPRAVSTTAGGVAVAATLAVFLIPLARTGDATLTSALLTALGVSALVAIVLRGRVLAARRAGVVLRQRAWSPAVVVALGLSVAGIAWAPLPVAETDRPAPAVHWIGPLATGVVALALLVLGAGLDVPLTSALGVAALVMTGSLLTPLEPLDGAFIPKGAAAVVAAVGLLGVAVFFLSALS